MSFLDNLYGRRKKLSDVLADEEYSGIRRIVEELYPDRAHFIYELLQNAEDTQATEVSFFLKEDKLIFEHNGRPFSEKDVEGITNIGKGTKDDNETQIGRFGIGFKAVFAYSETPCIWSPTFSFKIEQLVLPAQIPTSENIGDKTRFEFPFNNLRKTPELAFEEIASGIEDLSEFTLLFLRNIESIGWRISGRVSGEILRIHHSDHHVEVLKQTGDNEKSSSHFLIFSLPIEIDGRPIQSVSIAYALEFLPNISDFNPQKALSKQLKIVPANPGHVSVFLPAEKETSGLRFHLHAPFVTELSRASIKETSANDFLFNSLAELAASSLHHIRDLDLLSGEFLGVLPNPVDDLSKRYEPIRQSIIDAMNNKPLTPTYSKSHAPAYHLLQAKASLKELLSEEDFEFLVEYEDEPPKWAIGASQRNSNQDRFLAGLTIEKWDIEEFVELLCDKASDDCYWHDGPDKDFMTWLSAKTPEWHQQLYSMLFRELNENDELYRFKDVRIARLSDGSYSTGANCYFPGEGIEHDEILPRVDSLTYLSGNKKAQKENARRFLEKIGVREVGEAEQVKVILKQR